MDNIMLNFARCLWELAELSCPSRYQRWCVRRWSA